MYLFTMLGNKYDLNLFPVAFLLPGIIADYSIQNPEDLQIPLEISQ